MLTKKESAQTKLLCDDKGELSSGPVLNIAKKKQVPAKAQRRQGVERFLIWRAFFAPLRLCGKFFTQAE
jgi:hypothetical protein